MSDKKDKDPEGGFLDDLRQMQYPREFRIPAPGAPADPAHEPAPDISRKLAAEFATCLWYLKTKHFKRKWDDDEGDDDEPRIRRALGRINKSIETLKAHGIEIHDPTDERYPQGGEGMMRPIQFQPTDGLTYEVVTETVTPIVYRDDKLIQRGEVFVAVPKEQGETTDTSEEEA